MIMNDSDRDVLAKNYTSCATKAARLCHIPSESFVISREKLYDSIIETDRYLKAIHKHLRNEVSLGKVAGALCYSLSESRSITLTDLSRSDCEKLKKFRCLVAIMFVIETIIRTRPPEHIMAEVLESLYRKQLSQHALGIIFELFIQNSGKPQSMTFSRKNAPLDGTW
jgi:hypothetical protein